MFDCLVAAMTVSLYLAFAGTFGISELAMAVCCGILAVMWSCLVRRHSQRRFRFTRALYDFAAQTPRLLLTGTSRTTGVLLKVVILGTHRAGRALKVEFDPGRRDSGRDRSRRVLAVLIASLAPDSFVVRLDRGRTALLHSIVAPQSVRDPRLLI
jgi:hypothetical protein